MFQILARLEIAYIGTGLNWFAPIRTNASLNAFESVYISAKIFVMFNKS